MYFVANTALMASLNQGAAARNKGERLLYRPEAVALLDDLSANSKSASSVLDESLLSLRREKERQEMEERISRYYDERSEEARRGKALGGFRNA